MLKKNKRLKFMNDKETILLFSSNLVALIPTFIAFATGGFITAIVVFFISGFLIKVAMRG